MTNTIKKLTPNQLSQRQIDMIVLDKTAAMKKYKASEKAVWQQRYLLKKALGQKIYQQIAENGEVPKKTPPVEGPKINHHPKAALQVVVNGLPHLLTHYPRTIELFTDTSVVVDEDDAHAEKSELTLVINGESTQLNKHLKSITVSTERLVMVDSHALRHS